MVTEDVTIKGIHIPKGTMILFSPFIIQIIPEYFPEPEKFKPERYIVLQKILCFK